MSVPMRKDRPQPEQDLTTADLAQGKLPAASQDRPEPDRPKSDRTSEDRTNDARPSDDRPKPVLAGRPGGSAQNISSEVGNASEPTPLFPNNELQDLRTRWTGIQTAFVDEPRRAVEQADGLVASAMQRLAEVFAEERSKLEQQWDRGDNVSTEDLRVALQRYRLFFQRLLSI